MANEEQNAPEIEESTDQLAAPDSQEEKDEDLPDLSPEQRAQYDQSVKAVDSFIENHPTYRPTDENRQVILDYLAEHQLVISPASLELCWEQLKDQLDLEPEQRDEQPDAGSTLSPASSQLATYALARGNRSGEPPDVESEPDEQEPVARRGKPVVAWRNGRAVSGIGS